MPTYSKMVWHLAGSGTRRHSIAQVERGEGGGFGLTGAYRPASWHFIGGPETDQKG